MGFLDKAASFIGGNLFKEIKETALAYLPPDLSPTQKQEFALRMEELTAEKQAEANRVLNEASAQLDRRIAEQEGTAKDLLSMPIVGRGMLFARGMQRPVWGFGTLWIDCKWFFDATAEFSQQQEMALTVMNVLVLGFLFGERTVKNLEPLILKIFDRMAK